MLGIPVAIAAGLAINGLLVFSPILWLVTLVRGRMPSLLFSAAAAVIRFEARVNTYYSLVTDFYPRRLFGDSESQFVGEVDGRELRLWLSAGAKRLVALCLVLGVAAYVVSPVVRIELNPRPNRLAQAEMDLESASQTFASSCASRYGLHCLQTSELALSQAFDDFGSSVSRVTFSGSQAELAAALVRQAHVVAGVLLDAGVAPTDGANQRAFLRATIELNRFETDATALLGHPL